MNVSVSVTGRGSDFVTLGERSLDHSDVREYVIDFEGVTEDVNEGSGDGEGVGIRGRDFVALGSTVFVGAVWCRSSDVLLEIVGDGSPTVADFVGFEKR